MHKNFKMVEEFLIDYYKKLSQIAENKYYIQGLKIKMKQLQDNRQKLSNVGGGKLIEKQCEKLNSSIIDTSLAISKLEFEVSEKEAFIRNTEFFINDTVKYDDILKEIIELRYKYRLTLENIADRISMSKSTIDFKIKNKILPNVLIVMQDTVGKCG